MYLGPVDHFVNLLWLVLHRTCDVGFASLIPAFAHYEHIPTPLLYPHVECCNLLGKYFSSSGSRRMELTSTLVTIMPVHD